MSSSHRMVGLFLLPPLLILIPASLAYGPSGRIRVLEMGQVWTQDPVADWLLIEPNFDYVGIPCNTNFLRAFFTCPLSPQATGFVPEAVRKYIRIYFPRRIEDFIEDYDFILYFDVGFSLFNGKQLAMLEDATTKYGIPCLWSMGGSVFGLNSDHQLDSLLMTELPNMIPHKFSGYLTWIDSVKTHISINMDERLPPVLRVFKDLGIEDYVDLEWSILHPRPGTSVWAYVDQTDPIPSIRSLKRDTTMPPGGYPWLMSWEYGSEDALVWAFASDFDHPFFFWEYTTQYNHPYSPDVFFNILYHATGHPLPEDILAVHTYRWLSKIAREEYKLVLSLLDFVDKLGANTNPVLNTLKEARVEEDEAMAHYQDMNLEASLECIKRARMVIARASEQVLEVKNKALFWVFVIEWLAVTSMMLLSSFALWTLMIKKRLYREAGTTMLE